MRASFFTLPLYLLACSVLGSPSFGDVSISKQLIESELRSKLSDGAELVFSEDDEWANATSRWSEYRDPDLSVVVEAASAKDVQNAVKFARKYKVPFLARNRGHGSVGTLEKLRRGIQINIRGLNKIEINSRKNIATMGGGVFTHDVIQALYAAGKQSSTGSCSCVGLLGAGLGGGHGRLQGMHGLIADNIISADVVLSDGSLVKASKTQNPDLYWGLRGAGHNLGIVTQFEYKIHDIVNDGDWWWQNYYFPPSAIDKVFTLFNKIGPIQSDKLTIAALFVWTDTNSTTPILWVALNYAGKASETRKKWADKFDALKPDSTEWGETKWNNLAEVSFNGLTSDLCKHGMHRNQFSVGMKSMDLKSIRDAYSVYQKLGEENPGIRGGSFLVYELYPLQAYQAIPEETTAYPHRSTNVIALFQGTYADESLNGVVTKSGVKIRDILQKKSGFSKLQAYLNYAQGDETFGDLYGQEKWRQDKLRSIKRRYDPARLFNWYQPIPQ